MAIYLTAGAVEKLANGDVKSEIQMMPVLHVLRSSIIMSDGREMAVLWLTDLQGQEIQALLRGDLSLVRDRIVGPGSNIQLLQFTTQTTRVFPLRRVVGITKMNVISSSSDVIGQPKFLVPNTQESDDSVKPLVEEELKIFRKRIKDAKAFVCDTRTTKDGIRAAIRCFNMIITNFNMLLSDLRVPLEESSARPSNDDSEDLYIDQLRLNASSLYQFFIKYTAPKLLKLFHSTTNLPELNKIKSVVDGCSTSVYRLTTEGFDGKKEEDKDLEWFP